VCSLWQPYDPARDPTDFKLLKLLSVLILCSFGSVATSDVF